MAEFLFLVIYASLTLFIILDPILSIPVFVEITRGMKKRDVRKQALIAATVAAAILYAFLFFNFLIFNILNIDIASFQIAGGILLFILGLQMSLGISISGSQIHKGSAAGVVIGTPLLCGPGAITTVLIMAKEHGIIIPSIAIAFSVAATWLILKYASTIQKAFGTVTTDVLAKIMGMLVTAIAVKIIIEGIMAVMQTL